MATLTNAGLEGIAKLINGVSTAPFKYIAVGSGVTPEAIDQTALATEIAATAGAVLNVYPCYDGVNYADTPVETGIVDLKDKGASTEQHVYFPISCRRVKVAVENLDAAQSITGVSVWAHKQTLA